MGLVPNFIARFFQDMGHRADDLELMLAADTKKMTEEALTERSPRVLAVLIERLDDALLRLKEQKGTLDGLAQNALREAVLHENAANEADHNADLLLQQAAAAADPAAKVKKNDLAAVEDQRHESETAAGRVRPDAGQDQRQPVHRGGRHHRPPGSQEHRDGGSQEGSRGRPHRDPGLRDRQGCPGQGRARWRT